MQATVSDWNRWWEQSGEGELRALVMQRWDPIGVADEPAAADEYDSYLGPIASQLRQGAEVDDVTRYLHFVRTQLMGLPAADHHDARVAEEIVDWYAQAGNSAD